VGHHGFAGLQQQARQIAVRECRAQGLSLPKLLNMLNDWPFLSKAPGIRVCADT
jgi:hypothetical protein